MSETLTSDDSDRILVERYLEDRAEDAFRALYRAHTAYLFGLALRISGGRRDVAEEAVQEAWIRAAERLDTFSWRSKLRTWLGGFVVNCCREQLRRRPYAATLELVEPVTSASPEGRVDRVDLEQLLASLPEGQRTVFVLFAVEGYTHDEIAGLLGIAAGTSKRRLHEARQALRALRETHRNAGGQP